MESDVVYNGRDNSSDWRLEADGVPADLSAVTRFVLYLDSGTQQLTVDSDAAPSAFDATPGGGVVRLLLGNQGLAPGRWGAELVTYDPDHPDGLNWGGFALHVVG